MIFHSFIHQHSCTYNGYLTFHVTSSSSAKKAARVIAMQEEHQALMEEDDRCPFYKKYWRKFYRLATHGVNVDVFDVSFSFF